MGPRSPSDPRLRTVLTSVWVLGLAQLVSVGPFDGVGHELPGRVGLSQAWGCSGSQPSLRSPRNRPRSGCQRDSRVHNAHSNAPGLLATCGLERVPGPTSGDDCLPLSPRHGVDVHPGGQIIKTLRRQNTSRPRHHINLAWDLPVEISTRWASRATAGIGSLSPLTASTTTCASSDPIASVQCGTKAPGS